MPRDTFHRSVQSTCTTGSNLVSVTSAEVTDREAKNVHHVLWNTAPARELSGELHFTLRLKVLSQAIEAMRPSDIDALIGMDATYAGQRLYWMLGRGLVEKPDKKRGAYRITEKGKGYLANPPPEPSAKLDKSAVKSADESAAKSDGAKIGAKTAEKVVEENAEKGGKKVDVKESEAGKKEDIAIPSQADIFQSVAEQLSISKQKDRTPLSAVVYRVQRTAELNKASFRAFDQHKR